MNKMLTTYILSAALGFAGTLAVTAYSKADEKPRFYYRHTNGVASASIKPEVPKTGYVSNASMKVSNVGLIPSKEGYPEGDEQLVNFTISFDVSDDVKAVEFDLYKEFVDKYDIKFTAQCANKKCTFDDSMRIYQMLFVMNYQEKGWSFSEDFRDDFKATAKPTAYILDDSSKVLISDDKAETTELRHELKLKPYAILSTYDAEDYRDKGVNAYFVGYFNDFVIFDDNNKFEKMVRPGTHVTAADIAILEKLASQL